jgi:hypothetical protein
MLFMGEFYSGVNIVGMVKETIEGEHFFTNQRNSYGNKDGTFMGKLEKLIIQSAPHKPLSFFRFIDDVDMKWANRANCMS